MHRFRGVGDVFRGLKERGLSREKSLSREKRVSREKSPEPSQRPPSTNSNVFTASLPSWVKVKELVTRKQELFPPNDAQPLTTARPAHTANPRYSQRSAYTTDSGYSSQHTTTTLVPLFGATGSQYLPHKPRPLSSGSMDSEPPKPDIHEGKDLPLIIIPSSPPRCLSPEPCDDANGFIKDWKKDRRGSKRCISQWVDDVSNFEENSFLKPTETTLSPVSTVRPESRATDTESSDIFGDDESIFGEEFPPYAVPWDPSGSKIAEIKHLYAETLLGFMSRCIQKPSQSPQANEVPMGEKTSGGSGGSGGSTPASNSPGVKRKRSNRMGVSNDGNESGDGGDDGDSQRERPAKRLGRNEPPPLRFACPFFKKDPIRYRRCGFSDHENSSRVKWHINRKHCRPIYCPRCSEAFKSEAERDSHVRESNCPMKPEQEWEGITADQQQQLRRKSTEKTARGKWNAIFRILFPDDPLPSSPYLDASLSRDVNFVREAFLASAPGSLRITLERTLHPDIFEQCAAYIEEQLSSVHVQVFDQIFELLKNNRMDPGSCSPALLSPSQGSNSHVRDDGRPTPPDSAVGRSIPNSPKSKAADDQTQNGSAVGASSHGAPHTGIIPSNERHCPFDLESEMEDVRMIDLDTASSAVLGPSAPEIPGEIQTIHPGLLVNDQHPASEKPRGFVGNLHPSGATDPEQLRSLLQEYLVNDPLSVPGPSTTPDFRWAIQDQASHALPARQETAWPSSGGFEYNSMWPDMDFSS